MTKPTLSYILGTYNKLPYLKRSLEDLLVHKQPDEDVLVADGGSTDGTKEYLERLYAEGKLSYFVSEPDKGLAHALNKLALRAQGTLIKYITDDDIYDFAAIAACRDFMLAHPEIDLVNTNGGTKDQDPAHPPKALVYDEPFKEWITHGRPFSFNDMGLMLRSSSLSLTGLWNPGFPSPDAELSLRLSASKANIAWFTARTYVNISNPQSLTRVHRKRIEGEVERLERFYLGKRPRLFIVKWLQLVRNKLRGGLFAKADRPLEEYQQNLPKLIESAHIWLAAQQRECPGEFLHK